MCMCMLRRGWRLRFCCRWGRVEGAGERGGDVERGEDVGLWKAGGPLRWLGRG